LPRYQSLGYDLNVSKRIGLLGLCFILGACAAQDSHRQYYSAQRALKAAMDKNPSSADLGKAEAALNRGKAFLDEAKFDKAFQNFRESERLSEAALHLKSTNSKVAKIPAPVVAAPPKKEEKPAEPRALPREVLAKYLAGKRGESVPKATEAPTKEIVRLPLPKRITNLEHSESIAKAESKKPESQKPVAAPSIAAAPAPAPATPEPVKLAENIVGQMIEGQDASLAPKVNEVVKAPAKPVDKILKGQSEAQMRATSKAPAAGGIAERARTKVPGALVFMQNDASIEPESMMNLDQTSKFLLDNPSSSIMFQGIVGPGESSSLVDSRFESIRSYLVGKGVPEDQVRLDQKRRGGGRAEFEMYVIEH